MGNSKKPKVIFAVVEAGLGHIVPIDNAYKAFKSKYGDLVEVEKRDIFSTSQSLSVQKMAKEFNAHTINTANNFFYNKIETIGYYLGWHLNHLILKRHFKKAVKEGMEDFVNSNADLVFSTYYMPTYLTRLTNQKKNTKILTATYSPDPVIYPAWDRKSDMFFVNNNNAYNQAVSRGFKKDKVKLVPKIYKESVLSVKKDKDLEKEKLGLLGYTVFLTSGAHGDKHGKKVLDALLLNDLPITLVVGTGKNEKLKEYLNNYKGLKHTTLKVLGFVENIEEYMVASDIIIGKAGSNTLMEAEYLGCNFIICSYASILEKLTAKYYKKEFNFKIITNPKKLVKAVKEDIVNNKPKAQKEEKQEVLGAQVVADELFNLLVENKRI